VKFCTFVANLYPRIPDSFGKFIFLLIKIGANGSVIIVFIVSSLQFYQVKLLFGILSPEI